MKQWLGFDAINKVASLKSLKIPRKGRVCALVFSPTSRRLHFQTCKSSQVLRIDVGDRPEFKPATNPLRNIIAILTETFRGCVLPRGRRPNKQVNNMQSALVNECR